MPTELRIASESATVCYRQVPARRWAESGEIFDRVDIPRPSASYAMQMLRDWGVVEGRKESYYWKNRKADPRLELFHIGELPTVRRKLAQGAWTRCRLLNAIIDVEHHRGPVILTKRFVRRWKLNPWEGQELGRYFKESGRYVHYGPGKFERI